MDKRLVIKKIYERLLLDDTSTTEAVGARMMKLGFKCGSSRRGCLRGRFRDFIKRELLEQLVPTPCEI